MGATLSWVMGTQLPLFMFTVLAIWLFIEALSWLDPSWSAKTLTGIDEKALAEAAEVLGETAEEVRSHISK